MSNWLFPCDVNTRKFSVCVHMHRRSFVWIQQRWGCTSHSRVCQQCCIQLHYFYMGSIQHIHWHCWPIHRRCVYSIENVWSAGCLSRTQFTRFYTHPDWLESVCILWTQFSRQFYCSCYLPTILCVVLQQCHCCESDRCVQHNTNCEFHLASYIDIQSRMY